MEGAFHLTGITIVVLAAMVCGMLMTAIRQPPIVGYILAGVILGPSGLELVKDREQVTILAELGVLMLLYFIGMELSLRSFRRMWRLAVLTTLIQIGVSTGAMLLLMNLLEWPIEQAVLFGFVLALSSTAVAVRMLEDIGELRTRAGRITVGVLIAQDLAVAPMLLIIGSMSGGEISYWVFLKVAVSVAILTGAILFFSGRRKINLFFASLLTSKPDLAPLMALCLCFGFAAVSGLAGLSPPFGAFLAGLIVGSSAQRQHVYEMAKPIESILMMAFFLSIGLLIDLPFLWENLGVVILLWLFITVFKTALNTAVLHLLGERWQVAFLSSAVLAQIGEFSFVLGGAAMNHWIIGTDIHRMIVAVTVLSLVSSPLYLATARRIQHHAVHPIDSVKSLLRLVYSRELELTRRATNAVVSAGGRAAAGLRAAVSAVPFPGRKTAGPPPNSEEAAPDGRSPEKEDEASAASPAEPAREQAGTVPEDDAPEATEEIQKTADGDTADETATEPTEPPDGQESHADAGTGTHAGEARRRHRRGRPRTV
ncbi:MAG: cation:proton antiporter, partial [Pseudomonadota bacterium]